MSKKSKIIPSGAISRPQKKEVRAQQISTSPYPSWRFSQTDKQGPFAWPKGDKKELEILSKLHGFDSMKWSELSGSDHHNLDPSSLSKEAQQRLLEIGKDDEMESIFSFHISGIERIICIKDKNIAKLLWYDPTHAVCLSRKK